jgi:hypothetical protein
MLNDLRGIKLSYWAEALVSDLRWIWSGIKLTKIYQKNPQEKLAHHFIHYSPPR